MQIIKYDSFGNKFKQLKLITGGFLLILLIWSCQKDEEPIGINSPGQVKLDKIGVANDGWGILAPVVSHDGTKLYYALVNFQTNRYELRMIDSNTTVKKLFSGEGKIDALDISKDDHTLLYSISPLYGGESKLYEYPLESQIPYFLLSVTGDGYFWNAQYLPDGNIIYNQGDGRVDLSLRRLDRISREVTVLMDKSENPILIDIDEAGERLLVWGWSSYRIITLKFDGTELKDFGDQNNKIRLVCFSPEGSEILASETVPISQNSLFDQTIIYDVQTGEKNTLTIAQATRPLAYGKDKNELLVRIGSLPMELSLFDRSLNTYDNLTNNQMDEGFLGFYGNSSHRILFSARDQSGNNDLYIVNK